VFLLGLLFVFDLMIHYILSVDRDQQETVLGQRNGTYDAVVKFDTYRNLQRHRAFLPTI